ncbi:MAG: hypothetical protein AAGK32_09125, partial [Actinomycetota bacterium]
LAPMVALAVVGYLLGGPIGLVLTLASAIALAVTGPAAARSLSLAAAALLAGSGVMTIVESGTALGDLNLRFPRERPVADVLALAATSLLIAVLVATVRAERAEAADLDLDPDPVADGDRPDRDPVRPSWPLLVGGAVIVATVWIAFGAPALTAEQQQLADNLSVGRGYLVGLGPNAAPADGIAPLAPLVGAFAPGGALLWSALAAAAAFAGFAVVLGRRLGVPVALGSAAVLAVVPLAWDQRLAGALAALAVAGALLALDPARPRPLWALVAIGLGALAAPQILWLAPVLAVGWLVLRAATPDRTHPPAPGAPPARAP